MGNSNSSSQQHSGHHHHHHHHGRHQPPLQWSHSLEGNGGPDNRNRMKSGYFPPRHYIGHGHGGMVPPQKVLPAVNPAKEALRLKPTSNGAILHKGGTISGRKIQQLQELEAATAEVGRPEESPRNGGPRKRHLSASSIVNEGEELGLRSNGDFQRRSQRSIGGHTINLERSMPARDYDSEPEIIQESRRNYQNHHQGYNESPERSVSPLPNSFTLIQESPAKKQIRTKKKYQAPPPPPVTTGHHSPQGSDPHSSPTGFEFHDPHRGISGPLLTPTPSSSNNSGKKKLQRLFKTKAQAKEESNQRVQAESTTSGGAAVTAAAASSPSQMQIPHVRITRNSHHYNSKQWESKQLDEQVTKTASSGVTEHSEGRRQSSNDNIISASKNKKSAEETSRGDGRKTPSGHLVHPQDAIAKEAAKQASNDVTDSAAMKMKKTFYFGMERSEEITTTTSNNNNTFTAKAESHRRAEESLLEEDHHHNPKAPYKWNNKQTNKGNVGQRSSSSPHNQPQPQHQDELSKVMQLRAAAATKQAAPPPPPPPPEQPAKQSPFVKNNLRSDSESDGFNNKNNNNNVNNNNNTKLTNGHHRKVSRDSSSDLSSSDVDIPILIRPTLPVRRLDLPRFSPSAAWRALDSPRASGRSLSSEDGFSYEDRIQRYTRPSAPPRANNERSGDSGISAGDAGSPANAPPDHLGRHSSCSLSIGENVNNNFKSKLRKIRGDSPGKSDQKCWTPEQDLDESSSEFEHDVETPETGHRTKVPIGLQTPPKLTTRSNLFSNDTESINGGGRLYRSKNSTVVDINNDPESRRVIHHRVIGKNRYSPTNQQQPHQPYSLDTNWFLSRSEPNSLNVLGVEPTKNGAPKLSIATPSKPNDYLDQAFATEPIKSSRYETNGHHLQEVRSEIGYGPSSMNFYSANNHQSHSPVCDEDSKSASLGLFGRPFAHIMYLPSYDSRKFHNGPPGSSHYYANSRRTKSVDNLDSSESHRLYRRSDERSFGSQTHLNERVSRRDLARDNNRNQSSPFIRTQSVPLYKQQEQTSKPRIIEHKIHLEDLNQQEQQQKLKLQQQQEQREREQEAKRKKFKFQSTLRVLERKKIEAQLSREAEERERQRLREQEALQKVEEEFQKKRLQKQQSNEGLIEPPSSKPPVVNKSQTEAWDDVHANNIKNKFESRSSSVENNRNNQNVNNNNKVNQMNFKSSEKSTISSSNGSSNGSSSNNKFHLTKRQEPEGAPSFSTTTDLRKELIHASRKRNALHQNSGSSNNSGHQNGGSELTTELSEFRQETRQYCDYRRGPRTSSASPARYIESSSDIFPLSRRTPVERSRQNRYKATVHPEIVCDIPVKPFPYMVNFSSRLSGSASNLLVEERPGSGLGLTSGPSSVISDNYRRDWAHHIRGSGSSSIHGGGPGRASSIASLHSAPGYTSDNLRQSVTDLTTQDSPSVARTRKSPLFHKYSSSPPSSPLPPFSSSVSEVTDHDKDASSIITSTNGGPSSGIFQVQPFNRSKGYRPVAFKPPSSNHNGPIKLTSTAVK